VLVDARARPSTSTPIPFLRASDREAVLQRRLASALPLPPPSPRRCRSLRVRHAAQRTCCCRLVHDHASARARADSPGGSGQPSDRRPTRCPLLAPRWRASWARRRPAPSSSTSTGRGLRHASSRQAVWVRAPGTHRGHGAAGSRHLRALLRCCGLASTSAIAVFPREGPPVHGSRGRAARAALDFRGRRWRPIPARVPHRRTKARRCESASPGAQRILGEALLNRHLAAKIRRANSSQASPSGAVTGVAAAALQSSLPARSAFACLRAVRRRA